LLERNKELVRDIEALQDLKFTKEHCNLWEENKWLKECLQQAVKCTAEKFAELAKEKLDEWLKDNEDNDGKINFGIAEIELIGVKSLEGEVISESLIDEIAKEITEELK
jgi:predicted glycosyl hydrolase (DUF1957 family)